MMLGKFFGLTSGSQKNGSDPGVASVNGSAGEGKQLSKKAAK